MAILWSHTVSLWGGGGGGGGARMYIVLYKILYSYIWV